MVEERISAARVAQIDALQPDPQKFINYGTSGFRSNAKFLDRHCFRSGVFIAIKAKIEKLMGIMITASHNPKEDNGIKMIESTGGMLTPWWEGQSNAFMNSTNF
jgi:phosphoacetylglucosamine mutase